MMDFNDFFLDRVRDASLHANEPSEVINAKIFQMLLQQQLLNLQIQILGVKLSGIAPVRSGPFKGMNLSYPLIEGALLPKLLGVYEQELHPYILAAIHRNYTTIVDIGCGDGYYAVGMARLLPQAKIFAYDIDDEARQQCIRLAELNGVVDNVSVQTSFEGTLFADFPVGKTLIICDIEGDEEAVLDPDKYPSLKKLDLIVEMHEVFHRGVTQRLTQKFSKTHEICVVPHQPKQLVNLDDITLSEMDQMLLTYELREGPTPWAVMIAKK